MGHKSVRMFTMWDTDQFNEEFLGFLYLDLFPRPAKYTHAGHYGLSPVSISPSLSTTVVFTDNSCRASQHHRKSAIVLQQP